MHDCPMEVGDVVDSHDHQTYKHFGNILLTQLFDETASKSNTLDRNIRSAEGVKDWCPPCIK